MSLGCGEWGLCLGLGRVGEDYESPLSCDHFYHRSVGNDSNLLIVFYVQIMPDDFVMQLHRF